MLTSKILLGKYSLIKEIGKGGMGIVYLAKDNHLERKAAIKELVITELLSNEEKEDVIERFKREALAAASLTHPNIVTIFDVGNEDNIHFIAMEYLEGITLKDYIEKNINYALSTIVDIMLQIASGLEHAHSKGIIHRDIKPENIRITNDNTVKIMDFGIAGVNRKGKRLTQDGTMLGTIGYMSPEQLFDSKIADNRSDIFSFGAMFYEVFTGKLPFEAESVGQAVMNIMKIEPKEPKEIQASLPDELNYLIMKCLKKNPDERYQKFKEIEKDLNLLKLLIMNSELLKSTKLENTLIKKINNVITESKKRENITQKNNPITIKTFITQKNNFNNETAPINSKKVEVTFVNSFGNYGHGELEFSSPRNIYIDKDNLLWISDTKNSRVQVIDKNGNFMFNLEFKYMKAPCAVIKDNEGTIFILDAEDFKIRAFDIDFNCVFEFGGKGIKDYNLNSASSITISEDNKIYVTDPDSNIVKMFDNRGVFIKNITKKEEFKSPFSITYSNNKIFILDNAIPKIQANSKEGRVLFSFGKRGIGTGEFTVPRSIATDKNNNIYITEKLTHRVQVFNQNGSYLYSFGKKGTNNGEFNEPESIAINSEGDIFVLDRGNNRVQVFKIS
ncbi:MAG: protein kinase [Candidatus Sericytochromatia bacterium]